MRRAWIAVVLLAASCGPPVAPSFELNNLKGEPFASASLRGRVAVLYFWASWAPPSRLGLAQINRIARAAERRGIAVVTVAVEDDPAQVARALKGGGVAVPVLLGTDATVKAFFPGGGDLTLPLTLVVDERGRIVDRMTGYRGMDELAAALDRATGDATAGTATRIADSNARRQ